MSGRTQVSRNTFLFQHLEKRFKSNSYPYFLVVSYNYCVAYGSLISVELF